MKLSACLFMSCYALYGPLRITRPWMKMINTRALLGARSCRQCSAALGIYVFASPPPLMLPLGALLLLAVVMAGHARSSSVLAFRDRQASCADLNSPEPVQIVLERPPMRTRHVACATVCAVAVLASASSLAGRRACQHGDVEEAASLQQPLLGSARAVSLGALPKPVKSPYGVAG